MAGSKKTFVYKSDTGTDYAVTLDESNGELLSAGFTDLDDGVGPLNGLPRNLKMRYVNCINSATGATRKIFIGNKDAALFLQGGIVLLNLIASITGIGALLPFRITLAVGEILSRYNPNDTGLLDGDED